MAKKSPGLGEDMQQPLAGEAFNETSLASDGGRLKIGPGGRVVIRPLRVGAEGSEEPHAHRRQEEPDPLDRSKCAKSARDCTRGARLPVDRQCLGVCVQ